MSIDTKYFAKTLASIMEDERVLNQQKLKDVADSIKTEYQNSREVAHYCQYIDRRLAWQIEHGVNVFPCRSRIFKPSM